MFFIVFGISGVIALKSSFFPLIDSKFISINAIYPGASPQEVEEGVIYKIEENLKPIIKKITKNKIKIVNIIDKNLIGGFIIKIGDIQFDNSVNTSLNKLKTSLKKENTFI